VCLIAPCNGPLKAKDRVVHPMLIIADLHADEVVLSELVPRPWPSSQIRKRVLPSSPMRSHARQPPPVCATVKPHVVISLPTGVVSALFDIRAPYRSERRCRAQRRGGRGMRALRRTRAHRPRCRSSIRQSDGNTGFLRMPVVAACGVTAVTGTVSAKSAPRGGRKPGPTSGAWCCTARRTCCHHGEESGMPVSLSDDELRIVMLRPAACAYGSRSSAVVGMSADHAHCRPAGHGRRPVLPIRAGGHRWIGSSSLRLRQNWN
jgi:hypothetical protein